MTRSLVRGALAFAVVIGFIAAADHAPLALGIALWGLAIIATIISLRLAVRAPLRPVSRTGPGRT